MSRSKNKPSYWPKIRKFLNDIHLWGGLISGIVVLIVCLTGTIYVYNTEIREAVLSEFYNVKQAGEKINTDDLLTKVRPEVKGKIIGVKIPFAADKSTFVLYRKPDKGGGGRGVQGEHAHNHGRAGGRGDSHSHEHGKTDVSKKHKSDSTSNEVVAVQVAA